MSDPFTQFPALVVQYLTDDGTKLAQTCMLRGSSDASGRYTYSGEGFGPPRVIQRFSHPHDDGNQL